MNSTICLLNTRPAHQAKSLTQLIEKSGGSVFNLPLFEIHLIPVDIDNLDEFDCIIFLSANAVINYFQIPCVIAIGPATKSALEKIGIKNSILPAQFNSSGILALPEMQFVKNKKIAIFCGENSKALLPDTLKKRGATVKSIVCYRRQPIEYDMSVIFNELISRNINCIVSTSLESYHALLKLFKNFRHSMPEISDGKENGYFLKGSLDHVLKHGDCASPSAHHYRAWLYKQTLCVIHDAMKQQALKDGFMHVIQAKNATDEAIVAAIQIG